MIRFCVNRPIATSMAFTAMLLLALIGSSRLKVNLFPDIAFPRISVITPYSNVQAEEIENLVTRPIEDALSAVPGVRKLRSISQEGLSIVHVDLEWGSSTDSAIIQARQKVDLARSVLPQDTGKSMISRFDPSREPIMTLIARPSPRLSFKETREYIERNVRPLLERIEGVASVSIQGGLRREIQVDIDRDKLRSYNLTLSRIGQNLDASNYTFPAGAVRKGRHEYQVKVKGEFDSVESIKNAIVAVGENGAPVTLKKVGTIQDGFKDRTATAVHNGKPAILILIRKESDANAVQTADSISGALIDINNRFDEHVTFQILNDSSRHIVESINSVIMSALLGAVIAFAVLLFFLADIRTSVIIVISIPVSVLFTLLLMFLNGISVNIISLGGLALGTGMLVDNSIVVIESIQQLREKNAGQPVENAIQGAKAVSASVIASTATSVIVFLPILFVPGIAGAIFKDLSLTVTFSLIGSLLVSLTLIPMLSALPAGPAESVFRRIDSMLRPVYDSADGLVTLLQTSYTAALRRYLFNSRTFLLIITGLSAAGIVLLYVLDRELFPETEARVIEMKLTLQEGTNIDEAEAFIAGLQRHLIETSDTQLRDITTIIGMEEDDTESKMKGKRRPHHTESLIYLSDGTDSSEYLKLLKETVEQIPGTRSEVRIQGDILQALLGSDRKIQFDTEAVQRKKARSVTDDVQSRIASDRRILYLSGSSRASIPEIRITLDRTRLAALGLSVRDAALALRSAVFGEVSTIYREQDREIDVRLRFRKEDRSESDDLKHIPASLQDDRMVELSSFITSRNAVGFETILREDQRRLERIEIEAHPDEEASLMEDLSAIKQELEAADPAIQIRVQKTNQATMDSLKNLGLAFLLSSVLIYQLLAAQFESLIHPFTLILSIPMMFAGTSLALLLTGNTLNIQSTIGIVMLTGIVVNNAIVLYERISERLDSIPETERIGQLPQILNEAGRERLRPILLSTLTTILALLPLALKIGPGAEMQAPLAVVVIGGLTTSTVLTLICFPVIYYQVEKALASRRQVGARKS
ncbi:MAG: efflux RND transporter permease subunit [Leptonema illini]|uniref:Efflux RND transporter permease subunit n=1 Tax=Leptonema illini TaxID=183 RepID=A0A833GXK6_9LEPT|nr:MAG: efflux RND transporter permease subunit [Leptonema illini]